VLLTIGYERRSAQELISLLQCAGVSLVADVRERPLSRRPAFSRSRLQEALEAHGIAYIHMSALGSPREIRVLAPNVELAAKRYRQQVLSRNDGALRELVGRAQRVRVCLLCYEREPEECHRSLIAEEVAHRNTRVRVTHL